MLLTICVKQEAPKILVKMLPSTIKHTFLRHTRIITNAKKTFITSVMSGKKYVEEPLGPNDVVAPLIRNRNPMNLEKMRIGKNKKVTTENLNFDT